MSLIGKEPEEHSFDDLAMGLASGAITRRRALKLMGASVVGASGLSTLFADPAEARRRRRRKRCTSQNGEQTAVCGRRQVPCCGVNKAACCRRGQTCHNGSCQ